MAIGVLILGKSGTGKSYSMKNFAPDEVKILSVNKPILPFRGKYEIVKTPTGRDIIRELHNTKKKNIVIDDFQYLLGIPMMHRVSEKGWDKFNEIQQPYADVLEELNNLPDDVIVYLTSHTDTDNDGNTKIKTIGNALDKYITVEGLFMIVLGTKVVDDKYYFATQNSGNDTLKSPEGMFPSKWIPNDMKYVGEKIRNYYYMDGAKSDDEMKELDKEHTVAEDSVEPKRRSRTARKEAEVKESTEETLKALDEATDGPTEYNEAMEKAETKVRTRKNRSSSSTTETVAETPDDGTLKEDTYFYIAANDNYVKKHAGDTAPEGGKVITEEEFAEGLKRIAQENTPAMNPPEDSAAESTGRTRRRRTRV